MAAAVVACCLVVFGVLAEDVGDRGGLIAHDRAVLGWFIVHRSAWSVETARVVSTVGSFVGLSLLAMVAGAALWRRGVHLALAFAALWSLVGASLASNAAKAYFGRPRPPLRLHETAVTLSSFPSGHATDSAAMFVALALVAAATLVRTRAMRILVVATGMALAMAVALSRLVLGVHWPSDVVAGLALGTAVAVMVVATMSWADARLRSRA